MTPEAALHDALIRVRANGPGLRLGVAVSGGGDSMALLQLACGWSTGQNDGLGVELYAATVDHGLRPEAADEARFVAEACENLAVPHTTLSLAELPRGNIQSTARTLRYAALAGWARDHALDAVLLGHTADDQAETFVMRLARGSGVDGLAAMRSMWEAQGVRWLRPLLQIDREALRYVLKGQGQTWIEDPSNDDPKFERVRVRKSMSALAELGLDQSTLVDTARRMQDAREALSQAAHRAALECAHMSGGDVHFELSIYQSLPRETRHRLLAHAITYVSSTPYRPRYAALCALEGDILAGTTRTLQGCLVAGRENEIVIGRELKALADQTAQPGTAWDNRWVLDAPPTERADDMCVKALGEGILTCKDWRDTGLSRNTLMTSPALWEGDRLIAAPMAGLGDRDLLSIAPKIEDFHHRLLSH